MQSVIASQRFDYLNAPIKQFGIPALLICAGIYDIATNPSAYPQAIYVALLMGLALVVVLVQKPRWIIYCLLLIAFMIQMFVFVHLISNKKHDALSTRDAAVEVSAQTLLKGENAWNTDLGVGITTGPASILLAIPFVILFGQINWLTFIFWMLFFLFLLTCDVYHQNNIWPTLTLFFMLGLFDIEHTLFWSLDELYYPILYIALAYILTVKKKLAWTGALFAASVLSRPNYIFLVMGFGLWYLFEFSFDWRKLTQMGFGFLVSSIGILLPFVWIGGSDFWVKNPWRYALSFSGTAWPDTNFIFHALNKLNNLVGADVMRWGKLALTLLLMTGIAWLLRRANVRHPFWHVTAAALIAHTVVWLPAHLPKDYTLIFILPAMIAVVFTPIQLVKPLEQPL